MNRDQLRDLIASATSSGDDVDSANRVLAARLPCLCPDCKGSGLVQFFGVPPRDCTHPNAPTIADLLQWGERVAAMHGLYRHGGEYNDGWNDLLAELRGEGQ